MIQSSHPFPPLTLSSFEYPAPLVYAYAPFLLPLANIVVEQMKVRKRKNFPSPLFFKRIDNSCRSDQRMSIISTSITANTIFSAYLGFPFPPRLDPLSSSLSTSSSGAILDDRRGEIATLLLLLPLPSMNSCLAIL